MRKITEVEAVELAKNNYLKVIVQDIKSQKKFDKFMDSMLSCSKNNHRIEIIEASEILEQVDMTKIEENVNQNNSPIQIVNAYAEELDLSSSDIDPVKLKECFDTLYKEALLEEREGGK